MSGLEGKTYSHVFDVETVKNVYKLESDGYIGKLLGPIGTGKESYVFYSHDHAGKTVAVKIHRHSIDAFKKIPSYLNLRGTRSSGFTRRIDAWTRYEFGFQSRAFAIGINVPEPYRFYRNVIVMQFLGEGDAPALQAIKYKDFDIDRWYEKIIGFIVKMGNDGFIHGDLSAYNILNWNNEPYFIDFSQALKLTSLTKDLLLRDVRNINSWFNKIGKQDTKTETEIIRAISKEL